MVGLLRYKTAHKCSLSAPFRRPGVGRNPGVVDRFVAITALLPTPVRGGADRGRYFRAMFMTLISDDGSLSDFQT